jgi:hypothetical protein
MLFPLIDAVYVLAVAIRIIYLSAWCRRVVWAT